MKRVWHLSKEAQIRILEEEGVYCVFSKQIAEITSDLTFKQLDALSRGLKKIRKGALVKEEIKGTVSREQLKTPKRVDQWCNCGNPQYESYPQDGQCNCGIQKHHVHCQCGGVMQIG